MAIFFIASSIPDRTPNPAQIRRLIHTYTILCTWYFISFFLSVYLLLFSISVDLGFIIPFDLCFPMVDRETTPLLLSEEENGCSASRPKLSIPCSFQCFIYGIGRLRICTSVKIYRGPKEKHAIADAGRKQSFHGKP